MVGGRLGAEVSLTGNAIRGAMQGVHVGVAHRLTRRAAPGGSPVESNSILVSLPATAKRDRHGIFVSNADSIVITENQLRLARAAGDGSLPVDGIRVFGETGLSVIVRHNHLHDGSTPA